MNIQLNGTRRDLPAGSSLAALIAQLPLAGRRLAVERNGEIVPRSQYAQVTLAEGDRIEIVQAIGGG
ncbi:MAG TPA: sulfur carrier protein ThiS [Stenotrophobium sp.]|jgi:sulfur carrier protein|nr:sulfur carrier protein ThiS [Stenotrophobium sp.]